MHIDIDRNVNTIPTDYSWQFGIGNDHAYQLHRVDAINSLKLIHDQLNIKYVRCHGIFDDDMLTYQRLTDYKPYGGIPHAKNVVEINFKQIFDIYENILSIGMKPWVELSFMPKALAKGKKTGIRYLNNITKPKSLEKWSLFIKQFITDLIGHFSKEEVERWYFEVWNEPDLSIFFKGNQKDYFNLYKKTVTAIKEVDSNLKVGGPSSSACKWLDDFVNFCKDNNVPYDFVTTHHYPGDAFGNSFSIKDAFKMMSIVNKSAKNNIDISNTLPLMFYHPETYKSWTKSALRKMDDDAITKTDNKPLFITEWSSMAVFASPIHDEKYEAAFIVKSCLDLHNKLNGYMFWCASDIYEEQFMLGSPFHGGHGLVNNCGIPKPNFYAFKLLSKLYNQRLDLNTQTNSDVEYAAFKNDTKTQVIVYAQSSDPNENKEYDIDISINCLAAKVTAEYIDDENCNPKKIWKNMNCPKNLTSKQVEHIINNSSLSKKDVSFHTIGNLTNISFKLHTNDVCLISIE